MLNGCLSGIEGREMPRLSTQMIRYVYGADEGNKLSKAQARDAAFNSSPYRSRAIKDNKKPNRDKRPRSRKKHTSQALDARCLYTTKGICQHSHASPFWSVWSGAEAMKQTNLRKLIWPAAAFAAAVAAALPGAGGFPPEGDWPSSRS